MKYRAVGQPARKVLTVMTAAAACVSLAAAPAATASSTPVACRPWQALRPAGAARQEYVIRNKPSINHNDRGMCVSDPGEGAGFTVTHSPGQAPSREGAGLSRTSGPAASREYARRPARA